MIRGRERNGERVALEPKTWALCKVELEPKTCKFDTLCLIEGYFPGLH